MIFGRCPLLTAIKILPFIILMHGYPGNICLETRVVVLFYISADNVGPDCFPHKDSRTSILLGDYYLHR